MNYDDFFDKAEGHPSGPFRPRDFDRQPQFVAPLTNDIQQPSAVGAFIAGLTSVIFLSITEGTLLWVIFESLEDLGVVDRHLPWHPFVIIAFAVNLIRVFDRTAFARK